LVFAALSVGLLGVVGLLAMLGVITLPGWAWIAAGFLLLWNVQFLFLTMLGEYIVRTHRMVQRRPLYVIDHELHSGYLTDTPVEHAETFV
jgi:hypothetical protein